MKLHEDKFAFLNIINLIHEDSSIRADILEKDYYVTLTSQCRSKCHTRHKAVGAQRKGREGSRAKRPAVKYHRRECRRPVSRLHSYPKAVPESRLRIGLQEWQRALQSGSRSVFSCLWEQPPLEFCEVNGLEAHSGTAVTAKYLCLEVKADQCARALG